MRFIKYNITKEKSAVNTNVTTTVNNPTVDLSGVYSRLSEDEVAISEINRQVTQLNSLVNGLDGKYLRKDKSDDNSFYTLSIGNARSDRTMKLSIIKKSY